MKHLINKPYKVLAATLLIFLAFGFYLHSQDYVFAQTDQAATQLLQANTALSQAYTSVSNAESAGANVTVLIDKLNQAANLLAQAENAYRIGDNNTAINDANAVLPITQQVALDAKAAKQSALTLAQSKLRTTIAITIIAGAMFLLALFLVWRWLKRSYIGHLHEAKPEVSIK